MRLTKPFQPLRFLRSQAFSLVEVTLALGIAAFALIPIMALLPVGFQSVADADGEVCSVNVLSAIIADRKAKPLSEQSRLFRIPPLVAAGGVSIPDFGVSEDGTYVPIGSIANARYRIKAKVFPVDTGSVEPVVVHFRVSWPAQAETASSSFETVISFPQR